MTAHHTQRKTDKERGRRRQRGEKRETGKEGGRKRGTKREGEKCPSKIRRRKAFSFLVQTTDKIRSQHTTSTDQDMEWYTRTYMYRCWHTTQALPFNSSASISWLKQHYYWYQVSVIWQPSRTTTAPTCITSKNLTRVNKEARAIYIHQPLPSPPNYKAFPRKYIVYTRCKNPVHAWTQF